MTWTESIGDSSLWHSPQSTVPVLVLVCTVAMAAEWQSEQAASATPTPIVVVMLPAVCVSSVETEGV